MKAILVVLAVVSLIVLSIGILQNFRAKAQYRRSDSDKAYRQLNVAYTAALIAYVAMALDAIILLIFWQELFK